MDPRQNDEFTAFLRGAVRQAEALKYNPTRFKGMLEADGGFETVKRVLASGAPSDGFLKLWKLGRLDLTCEAIIVESKWRQFFDEDLLERAEKLLRGSNYAFRRFGPVPMKVQSGWMMSPVNSTRPTQNPHSETSSQCLNLGLLPALGSLPSSATFYMLPLSTRAGLGVQWTSVRGACSFAFGGSITKPAQTVDRFAC